MSSGWQKPRRRSPELYCCSHPHTHWGGMHTFTHTQDYFAIWLNTVYFLICLILWCKCSVLLWCVGEGSFWVFLDFWVGQRRFSISVTVTSSLSFTSSCFRGESFAVLPFSRPARDWKFETPFCWNWSQAHSWFFSVRAVVFLFFFFPIFPVATIQHVSSSCWLTCI